MARINVNQTNFTAGEISPRMYGRVDLERFQNAAKEIENGLVLAHGGVMRRHGIRFVAEAKVASDVARLIPFVFNVDQAYIIEAGNQYFRFYMDGGQILSGGVPYEVTTTYAVGDVPALDYAQGADTMFLAHETYYPQRLRRFGHAAWVFDAVPFVTEPFTEGGHWPATTLTLSAAAVGTGRTFTAGAAAFLASDVGRQVEALGGVGIITAVTSATVATVNITTAFPSTNFTADQWTIAGSPNATITPTASAPAGAACTLNATVDVFRAGDVGAYVEINGGLVRIDTVTSAQVASGIIKQELISTAAAVGFSWVLSHSAWNVRNGYPRSVSLNEQRLWFAAPPAFPQTVWGSRLAEYLNFELGVTDDAAVEFGVVSDQLNPIRHIAQMKALVCFTYGGEFTLHGGVEKPVTPTNVQVKNQSAIGCNGVSPVRVLNELLFWNRAGRQCRAISADRFDANNYNAPDLTVLAEHITESGVVDCTFQADPEPWLFAVRADGVVASCTLDRDQDIVAWSRQRIGGGQVAIEAIATVPYGNTERTWVIGRLVVNGASKRYVGYFDPELNTDFAVTATAGVATKTWGGLAYLEGMTVDVVGDGYDLGAHTVTGGQVVLQRAVSAVEIGLNYATRIKLLQPEFPTAIGTMQASPLRVVKAWLRLKDSIGGTVNGEDIVIRQFGEQILDQAPTPKSGLFEVGDTRGWAEGETDITIEQTRPMPFHLLSVIRHLEVGG